MNLVRLASLVLAVEAGAAAIDQKYSVKWWMYGSSRQYTSTSMLIFDDAAAQPFPEREGIGAGHAQSGFVFFVNASRVVYAKFAAHHVCLLNAASFLHDTAPTSTIPCLFASYMTGAPIGSLRYGLGSGSGQC